MQVAAQRDSILNLSNSLSNVRQQRDSAIQEELQAACLDAHLLEVRVARLQGEVMAASDSVAAAASEAESCRAQALEAGSALHIAEVSCAPLLMFKALFGCDPTPVKLF